MSDLQMAMRRAFFTPKTRVTRIVPEPVAVTQPLEPEPAQLVPIQSIKTLPSALSTNIIIRTVAAYFHLTHEQIVKGRSRVKRFCQPRQIAMYLAHEYCRTSLPELGRKFDKDHTTILNGYRRIKELIETDTAIAQSVTELRQILFLE